MLHPTTPTPPPNRSRFAGSWRGDFCGQWLKAAEVLDCRTRPTGVRAVLRGVG
jgi:hypothetical protein